MSKPYAELTEEERERFWKRMHVWQHNAMVGGLHLALANVRRCIASPSSSQEATMKAVDLTKKLKELIELAKPRIDPPES